jgi:hypothetical protein
VLNESCDRCKFFMLNVIGAGGGTAGGFCRRLPPTVFQMKSTLGQTQFLSQAPPVLSAGWCGEYNPRLEVAN